MEKRLVIKGMLLKYEGLFGVLDLYKLIDDWTKENGYDKFEKESTEYVKPEGKYIEMRLEPYKKVSDYVQNRIVLLIFMKDVKEADVEIDRKKHKLNKGNLAINFDAYLETDYEHRWEQKPTLFFIRTLVDKYIYKIYTQKFESNLKNDVNSLHTAIKSFLNLYRY